MEKVNAFLKRKNIVFSAKRYGIDALGAMAQGLFCSLLIGTILNTLGTQFHIGFLTAQIGEKVPYTIGGLTSFMSGPAMGHCHRLRLAGAPAGAVLSGGCGLRLQPAGRRGRPLGRAVRGNHRCGVRQGRQQRDEDRHSGDPHCHHPHRRRHGLCYRPAHRHRRPAPSVWSL